MELAHAGFLFGRVIRTDAVWTLAEGAGRANLLYIYADVQSEPPPPRDLSPDRLLLPPVLTNRLGWSRGYFETVEHRPLTKKDLLSRHCFRRPSTGVVYDDDGNEVADACMPIGDFALHSYSSMDDAISRALSLPLAED